MKKKFRGHDEAFWARDTFVYNNLRRFFDQMGLSLYDHYNHMGRCPDKFPIVYMRVYEINIRGTYIYIGKKKVRVLRDKNACTF